MCDPRLCPIRWTLEIICDNLYAVDCNVRLVFQKLQCERK
jgi:hypothetical protein